MRYDDLRAPKRHISQRVFQCVKLSPERAIDLAQKAGFSNSTLSLVLHRRRKVHIDDPRMLRLGKLLGLKRADLFEEEHAE